MDISLTGQFYEKQVLQTKYDFLFSNKDVQLNIKRLTNQLWKLIPMRENDEDWRKQLDTVRIEIVGLNEIFLSYPQFLQLLSKLEGLQKSEDLEFDLYRKTIFESINLLQEINRLYKI